jgi:predicted phosphodiesterase
MVNKDYGVELDWNGWTDEVWDIHVKQQKDLAMLIGMPFEKPERPVQEVTNPEVMIIGDTHGNLNEYMKLLKIAKREGVTKIFQAGDCGLFPSFHGYTQWLDAIQAMSAEYGIKNYWIRGNHDDPDEWQHVIDRYSTNNGWGTLRSTIFLAPRVHYFKHNGVRFLGVGGAVSIDKASRLARESKPNTQWWPNEIISVEDVDAVERRHIDVLITHECSNYTHFRGRMKNDPDSESNRRRLDEVLKRSTPDWHFHGHMHTMYDWENYMVHEMNHSTHTIGLECNQDAMWGDYTGNNWGIFDTNTLTWRWQGKFNNPNG